MTLFLYFYIYGYKLHKKVSGWLMGIPAHTQMLVEAFWLAVLSDKVVAAIDAFHYKRSSKYKGGHFNKSMLSAWEEAMVGRYFGNCHRIMVLAAGGGREVFALLKAGYEAEGYECNETLVQEANSVLKSEGYPAMVFPVAPGHAPANGIIYDGVILGWGAYIHVRGRAARLVLLKEIALHLNSGSPFLLSYWFAHPEALNYCRKLHKTSLIFSKIFRTKPSEQGARLAPFSGRYFTHEEIASELAEAGFKVVYSASDPYGYTVALKQ